MKEARREERCSGVCKWSGCAFVCAGFGCAVGVCVDVMCVFSCIVSCVCLCRKWEEVCFACPSSSVGRAHDS